MRIGIDLGGTKIEAAAIDADGRMLSRRRRPTPAGDYQQILDAIADLVRELENEHGGPAAVGVATPGALSVATDRIKNSNSQCLNGQPLGEDLEQRLQRPVRLANDADCFALSEAIDGVAEHAHNVFGIIIGTGTGGGIVIDKKLVTGPNAIAGEWGHNPLPWPQQDELPGPSCYCGKRGCIETFLSGPGMAWDHKQSTGRQLTAREIVAAVAKGEAGAAETLGRYVDRMARALAGVINILDPDVIVLGGGLSKIDQLYSRVPECWDQYVFSDRVDTRLLQAKYGDSSGVRGAARLWPAAV